MGLGFRRMRIDLFEAMLLALLLLVVGSAILFCATPLGAAEPQTAADAAAAHAAHQAAMPGATPPVIQPVSRVVEMVTIPAPKRGWVWTSDPLSTQELDVMAEIYADYDKNISELSSRRIRRVLQLLRADAGRRDADLQALLYYLTYRETAVHPLRGLLDQKNVMQLTTADVLSPAGVEFVAKMQATCERYGLE